MAKELSQQTLFNFFKSVNPVKQSAVPNMPAPLLKVANEAVQKENQKAPANREEIGPIELGKRGCYKKYSGEERIKIAKYAKDYSDKKAALKFSVPEESARRFRMAYQKELTKVQKTSLEVTTLPSKSKARPTLLPSDIDALLREYLLALRSFGGVVNSIIVRAVAKAILLDRRPDILKEKRGTLELKQDWAKKVAIRFGLSRRKETRSTKAEVQNKDAVCEEFRKNVKELIIEHKIPKSLVMNTDESGLNIIPAADWTLDTIGSKQVPKNGSDDKREITGIIIKIYYSIRDI